MKRYEGLSECQKKIIEKKAVAFYTKSLTLLEEKSSYYGSRVVLEDYYTPQRELKYLEEFFEGMPPFDGMNDIRFIFCRLFFSMQNSGYRNFVKLNTQGTIFREILCDFNPKKVFNHSEYNKNSEVFADYVICNYSDEDKLNIGNPKIKEEDKTNHDVWRNFLIGVFQIADFLYGFDDCSHLLKEFEIEKGKCEEERLKGLQNLIKRLNEIKGIGDALALDFLKESDIVDIMKHDVHIKEVLKAYFSEIEDAPKKLNKNLEKWRYVYDIMVVIKQEVEKIEKYEDVTIYKIDKIIWLLCTENFYIHFKDKKFLRDYYVDHLVPKQKQ